MTPVASPGAKRVAGRLNQIEKRNDRERLIELRELELNTMDRDGQRVGDEKFLAQVSEERGKLERFKKTGNLKDLAE